MTERTLRMTRFKYIYKITLIPVTGLYLYMVNYSPKANTAEADVGGERQDELFDVLSDRRRRSILGSLGNAETPISVAALATELASGEAHGSAPDRSDDRGEAIKVSLLHTHLPKMAAAGVVRYDDTRQTVSLGDRTEEARAHLQEMTTTSGSD